MSSRKAITSLRSLEDEVESKNRAAASPRASQPGAVEQLDSLDARINAKQGIRPGRRSRTREQLGSLDARISEKQDENISRSLDMANVQTSNENEKMKSGSKVSNEKDDDEATTLKRKNLEDDKYMEAIFEEKHSALRRHDDSSTEETTPIPVAAYGVINEPDFMGGFNDGKLAVAVAISDEEQLFIPSAIEYDPDSKPPLHKNRRFRFYVVASAILLFAIGVSATLAVFTEKAAVYSPSEAPTSFRESLLGDSFRNKEIWKEIVKEIGESSFETPDSPGSRALDWIMNKDPAKLPGDSQRLIQRYTCALFYLSTTESKQWLSCNRPLEGEDGNCTAKRLVAIEPNRFEDVPSSRWLSGEHECGWYGIFCDSFWQVRAFEIRAQEIRGTLPSEIAKMPYMQSLSIMWNELHGTLPSEIANMKHLMNIEVHMNFFTGEVPLAWFSARALQRINVAGNFITGTVPTEIGLLRSLKGYFNFDNDIIGTIPTEIGQMKFLSYTRWARNFLTGTLPSEIGNLKKLQEAWMHRNLLTGQLPSEMGKLSDVSDIRLHYNGFSGTVPEELYNMTQLRRWDLYDSNFTSTISTMIGQMRALKTYRIRKNNFYGTVPTEIGNTPLNVAWFHHNKLTGEAPRELCALRSSVKNKGLKALFMDCAPADNIGEPLIKCMSDCCTTCCDPVGDTSC